MASTNFKNALQNAIEILDKKYGSHKAIALKFGIDEGDFSRKYNGRMDWTFSEAAAIFTESGYSLIKSDKLSALYIFALDGLKEDI